MTGMRGETKMSSTVSESHLKAKGVRKKVESLQNFFLYFMREQSSTPWQSLLGPGPADHLTLSLTHVWYLLILSFVPVCSLLSDIGIVKEYVASDSGLCDWTMSPRPCESIIVVFITYRLGFAIATFFFFTALLLIRTAADRFTKTAVHTGFWIEKIVLVLVLACVSFAFPGGSFDSVWIYVLYISSFLVCLLQMLLIIDLANLLTRHIIFGQSAHVGLKFILHFLPVAATLGLLGSLLLKLFSFKCQGPMEIVLFVVNTTACISAVIYVTLRRNSEILHSLCVTCYVSFLTYIATTYRQEVCGLVHYQVESSVLEPNFHSISALLLFYVVFTYGVIRADQPYYFFYGYWCLASAECSQEQLDNYLANRNEDILIAEKLDSEDSLTTEHQHQPDCMLHYNPNETLVDMDLDNDRTKRRLVTNAELNAAVCKENAATEAATQLNNADGPLKLNPSGTTVAKELTQRGYSEAMIHFVFFLVSSHLTLTVTSWFELEEVGEVEALKKPVSSVAFLYTCSTGAVAIYWWVLLAKHAIPEINITSTLQLAIEFCKLVLSTVHYLFYRTPEVFETSSSSRYVYTMFFFSTFSLACVTLSPFIRRHFESSPIFCSSYSKLGACISQDPAFLGIYRVLAACGIFFFILAVALVRISSTKDTRDVIHNGCWLTKTLFLVGIFIILLYVPADLSKIWLYASLFCTFLYTLMQLITLLDLVSILNVAWTRSYDEKTSMTYYYSSSTLAGFLYVVSTAAFVCFYVYFVHNFECKTNRLFISLNLVLCVAASLISIHPIVKSGGLLKSAIVTSFCMYQTWSALTYNPEERCNPLARTILMFDPRPSRDVVSVADIFFLITSVLYFTVRIENITMFLKELIPLQLFKCRFKRTFKEKADCEGTRLSADVLNEIDAQYTSTERSNIEKWLEDCSQHKFELHSEPALCAEKPFHQRLLFGEPKGNNQTDEVERNVPAKKSSKGCSSTSDSMSSSMFPVTYSYFLLHFVHFLACAYAFVLLTHWLEPVPGSNFKVSIHWAIMSMKMVASSLCVLLYTWTLVVPVLVNFYERR